METPIDEDQYQSMDENDYQSIEELFGETQIPNLPLYPSDFSTQRSETNYYGECPIQRMNSSQMVCQNPLMDPKKKKKKKKFPFFNRNKANRNEVTTNRASRNEVAYNEYFTLSQIREDPDSLSSLGEIDEFNFSSDEGKSALDCIHRICGNIPTSELVSKIISKDLILQDKIGYILKKEDINAYQQLQEYFSKFKESEEFLNIKIELTIEDIEKIQQQYSLDDTTKISEDLNIVESVINEYKLQYSMSEMEKEHHSKKQVESLIKLSKSFKNFKEISIDEYKKISTNTHKTYVDKLREDSDIKSFDELFQSIIPIAFYCMKCNLPLDQITDILREINEPNPLIPGSNHEIFHLIFQHSTPIVKALCIDLYSFCSPVPFYYPLLSPINDRQSEPVFKICHELWFTIPPCFAIASFGLGSASYLPVGKSELLNKLFNTNFTHQNLNDDHFDPFHFKSIDVQITKNIQLEGALSSEERRVAYFDCHSGVSMKLIKSICRYVNIMIIHVLEKDKNHEDFHRDMEYFSQLSKIIIVLVRDCKDLSLDPSGKHNVMHIPILSTCKSKFLKTLKDSFRRIIHSEPDLFLTALNPVQSVLSYLQDESYEVINNSIAKINKITNIIEKYKVKDRSGFEEPDFLSFYPLFVKYMSSFNRASQETDTKVVDQLNDQCASVMEELGRTTCSEIVPAFLELFDDDYSGLLFYKLSKYFVDLNKCSPHQPQKYRYSNDILWREALLTFKHNENMENYDEFTVKLKECLSKQIMGGEPFEIIDGDNLGFYSKNYDILLEHYYKQQKDFDSVYNKGKKFPLSAAPTVISIFGPQSSGKSTLLNYCFGCKFITSAGRCTQGVYGSLFQMHEILNNSRNLLILDTEGLNSIESKTDAKINFDQTMALFCLAVSQIVIINVKGEIGSDLKKLLQVCAYSLNRLKVNKVNLPKIFLVLNQQADPNVAKYTGALKHLMDSLDSTFHTADSECVRISDLIKVSTNDLFVLPSAFNVESIADYPLCENDKSKARKFQPTTAFAEECSSLRSAIFEAIRNRDNSDKPPFDNFSEWIQMAGHVWETCVKYQDIVMYRDLEEVAFAEKLRDISLKVIDEEIYRKQDSFEEALGRILKEVDTIESCCDSTTKILTEKMESFDGTFKPCEEECRKMFNAEEKKISLCGQFDIVYKQALSNLNRLIYLYRKNYEDKIKFRIQYLFLEIKIRDSMKIFQEKIEYRIDNYINFSEEEKLEEFEKIWRECYEAESEDLDSIRSEHFENLYKNFKIECNFIENQHHIWNILRSTSGNFGLDVIISDMEWKILHGLKNPDIKRLEECYFCILNQSYGDFTRVTPSNPRTDCVYLSPNSFVRTKEKGKRYLFRKKNTIPEWVPKECYPIVKICSGDFNNYEVVWGKCSEKSQILLLSSKLRNPNDPNNSCWDTLINEVRKQALTRLSKDPKLSQTTIKQLISDLYSSIKVVNHEIKYIRTMLSNQAERQLSTLLFSYAFREYWNYQVDQIKKDETRREEQKNGLRKYFFQKIDNRKMLKGEWDTKNMIANDKNISEKFAMDYLESIKRYVLTTMQIDVEKSFEELKESLTMEQLLLKANSKVNEAIECDSGVGNTDEKKFVVEFICKRNILLEKIFHQDWHAYQEEIKQRTIKSAKQSFNGFVTQMIDQLKFLIADLDKTPENLREMKCFNSDNNFSLHESAEPTSFQAREAPFKAMSVYLSKYLNPMISREQMSNFLEDEFIVDGVRVERSSNSILPLKRFDHALDNENFKRLENTNIFHEFVFDIFLFATTQQFQRCSVWSAWQLSSKFRFSDSVQKTRERIPQRRVRMQHAMS